VGEERKNRTFSERGKRIGGKREKGRKAERIRTKRKKKIGEKKLN